MPGSPVDPGTDPGGGWGGTNQFGSSNQQFGGAQQFGPSNQQFGGAQQFGSSNQQFGGAQQFVAAAGPIGAPSGQGSAPYGWMAPTPGPLSAPFRARPLIAAVVVIGLLLAGGLVARDYFFPDLSKPITLPATVAGLSQGTGTDSGLTMQMKDKDGHSTAMSMYADNMAKPTTFAMVIANRSQTSKNDLPSSLQVSTIGKLTCTADTSAAELLAQSPGASQGLVGSGMSVGAVCWRGGRHFTAIGFAFTGAGSAQSTAMQAVNAAWDAR